SLISRHDLCSPLVLSAALASACGRCASIIRPEAVRAADKRTPTSVIKLTACSERTSLKYKISEPDKRARCPEPPTSEAASNRGFCAIRTKGCCVVQAEAIE